MAIWLAQFVGREIRLLDYIEDAGQPLAYYAHELRRRGWKDADRIIAEEERTYGRLLELGDHLNAIVGELDRAAHSPEAALPNISNIIAMPSRFPRRRP
jgi:hypothetical protein